MSVPIHKQIGSLWNRWDLHFHTPSSYDVANNVTNKQIIDTLIASKIRVVAITDHHFMDIERINNLQELGAENIVVLPGIEVPTELGGTKSVHLTSIFSEDSDIEEIWKTIEVKHKLSPKRVKEIGDESVFVDCVEFCETVHELGGITIAHAGGKSNGIEEIGNSTAFKQFLKTGLVRNSLDILELSNKDSINVYRDIVFPKIGKILPLIKCSDSHVLSKYSAPNCWIKSDPSFLGLLQVLNEPFERVSLDTIPEALIRISQDKTRYITRISFSKTSGSKTDNLWFDSLDVKINPGLVAIIGNKGSGKSALAEAIGLLGGSKDFDYFSFLNKKKFLKGRTLNSSKAALFEANLKWLDQTSINAPLSSIDNTFIERLRYIPQNYLESICNELQNEQGSKFRRQIEKVVMSHLPIDERYGYETINELIAYRTSEIKDSIQILREQLYAVNYKIAFLENTSSLENQESLKNQLTQKELELKALDEAKPIEIPKPSDNPDETPELKEKALQVETLENETKELTNRINTEKAKLANDKKSIITIDKLERAIKNFQVNYESLTQIWEDEYLQPPIPIENVVSLSIDLTSLLNRRTEVNSEIKQTENNLNEEIDNSLAHQLKIKNRDLNEKLKELSEPQKAYQEYLDNLTKWETKKKNLIGDAETPETINYLKSKISEFLTIPDQIKQLHEQRMNIVDSLFSDLVLWQDVYDELYQPVKDFITTHPLASEKMKLGFKVALTETNFSSQFFEIIRQDRKGTYCHSVDYLTSLILNSDFESSNGVKTFIKEVEVSLNSDLRTEQKESVIIENQLKDGKTRKDLYNLLYELDYLKPSYSLEWAGKDLDQLSPGERGALLLVFYLIIDKDTNPIIIDQPEENLDNESVFEILVPCIKEARKRRQIIIVTHNPNLAVVCDADQIIRAELDIEEKSRLNYISGSIENPSINSQIVDILEGTRPAFKKRDFKYSAANSNWDNY